MFRYDIINFLIEKFKYENYLEIGVRGGTCFQRIQVKNKDGVDPNPDGYPQGINYVMTSDDFFKKLSSDKKYDIAFVDGLHQQAQVMRDVQNCLRHLNDRGDSCVT